MPRGKLHYIRQIRRNGLSYCHHYTTKPPGVQGELIYFFPSAVEKSAYFYL